MNHPVQRRPVRHSLLGLMLAVLASIVLPSPLAAQTTNPNVVQFIPSSHHSTMRSDGRPVVTRYDLTFYQAGTTQAVLSIDLGKPAPQADGLIRIDFTNRVAAWPLPGVPCEARVAAIGPDGNAVSDPSNDFVYTCTYSISSTGQSFAAAGGNGSVQVSAGTLCGWSARSSASWITVTSGASGVANGTVAYSVAANTGTTSRTGTLTIAGRTYTVSQTGGGGGGGANVPPSIAITSPESGGAYSGSLQVSANATDSDGGIARVELLANGAVIRTLTAAPYSFVWSPSATGSYSLTAIAYDTTGARTTSAAVAVTIVAPRYLGDLPWTSMTNGWGPVERNRSNGEQAAGDGRTITLNGRTYTRGLGAHARSEIRYPLNGACSTFQADLGLDDETGAAGSVAFEVWADGTRLFASGVMRSTTATRTVAVDVAGRRELALVVTDGGDDVHSDHGDWADARVSCTTSAPTTTRYLSDLAWTSATNGWGPVERDRSNGEQGAADGRTITLNGTTYAKGLGVHARSDVRYALNGTCSSFQASVGLDDETGTAGSVVFEVWADGTKLFDSGVMQSTTATRSVNVNLAGRRELSLIVGNGGDNVHSDHGDWANARIVCTSSTSNTSTTVAP